MNSLTATRMRRGPHRAGAYIAYFRGNVPVAEPQVNGRQPPGLHAVGDSEAGALKSLLTLAELAESKLRNELGNAKLRVQNIKRLLKPVEVR